MAWGRVDDGFNAWEEWMRATELAAQRGDDRLVLELKGAAAALYTHSAMQWTDYVVSYGAAITHLGMTRAHQIINDLLAIGILTDISTGDKVQFRLLESKDRWHNIRSDERKHAAKRKRDRNRAGLQVPVLLRDGDQCRYCGSDVAWGDTRSESGHEFDHRQIEEDTTPDNYVVSCRGCNQLRADLGDQADTELPLLDPPEHPIYGAKLRERLSRWAPTVARTARKLGIPNPLTGDRVEARPTQPPAGDTAPTSSSRATPTQGLSGNHSERDPQFPEDSHPVESEGRAATPSQQHLAASPVTPPTPDPSPQGLSDTQSERDPQGHQETHVRDSGPANCETSAARKRRRRRR